jgi:hypothetical protein
MSTKRMWFRRVLRGLDTAGKFFSWLRIKIRVGAHRVFDNPGICFFSVLAIGFPYMFYWCYHDGSVATAQEIHEYLSQNDCMKYTMISRQEAYRRALTLHDLRRGEADCNEMYKNYRESAEQLAAIKAVK